MRKVTIKDVAKQACVSIGTVSKVLNEKGYVSQEVRLRVLDTINQLNYRVNANARSLKASKTNKVGVIVSDISNRYMMSVAKAIEDMIRPIDFHLLVMSHNEDETTERKLLHLVLEQCVDGLVLIPTGANADMIQAIQDQHIPVVIVDRKVEGITCDLIVDDNYYGSFESIQFLNTLGHHRIGIIYGSTNISIGKERLQGALDGIKQFHCAADKALIKPGKFTVDDAYKATLELLFLPEPPTAIYCCNNTMTVGMLKAIQDQRLSIPDDISVISYGEVSQWELIQPPLTLMTQPLKRIGVEAAIIIKNRLTISTDSYTPRQIVIRPELLVRGSCSKLQ